MTKVPLVIYTNGERKIIGEAAVDEKTGYLEGRISPEVDLEETIFNGFVFGSNLGTITNF